MAVSFSGLTSGLDTDQIISKLLTIERRPIKRFKVRVQQNNRTQDAFRDLNNRLANLATHVGTLADPDTYDRKSVSSSHADVVGAEVVDADKATPGRFDVYVEQLATAAERSSGRVINDQKMYDPTEGATSISDFELVEGSGSLDLDSTDYLAQVSRSIETSGDATHEFTIGQGTTSMDVDLDAYNTFQELIDDVNATFSDLEMRYDSSRDKLLFVPTDATADGGTTFTLTDNTAATADNSQAFLKQIGVTVSDNTHTFDARQSDYGENLLAVDPAAQLDQALFTSALSGSQGTISVNGTAIDWDLADAGKPDTVNELIAEINDSVEGVSASYNSATDRVRLKTENTGAGSIEVVDDSGNLADVLNLRDAGSQSAGQAAADATDGTDARVTIDGTSVTGEGNRVTFNGVELRLKQLYSESNHSGDPVVVDVGRDLDSVAEDMQAFVDQFNSVVEFINKKSTVDPPDEPGAEGGDSGPFVGDSLARRVRQTLQRIVTDRYKDATGSPTVQDAASLGLELKDPLLAEPADRGKLTFDRTTFEQTIKDHREAARDLLGAETSDGDPVDGLATRLDSFLEDMTDELLPDRIDQYDDRVHQLEDRIDRHEESVLRKKQRLQDQFLQMEQMLARLQSQQGFIQARL